VGIDVVAFIFGAVLLATGLWGGGVSIKDLSVPKIGPVSRASSIGLGIVIILMGIGLNEIPPELSRQTVPPPPSDPLPDPQAPLSDVSSTEAEVSDPLVDPDQDFKAGVGQQLILISQQVGLEGHELTHEPYLGQLEDNTQEQVTLELNGGINYSIVGVCDTDCGDIDLELYDENGNVIDSDTMTDSVPVVEVSPQRDGPFTLIVTMPSCTAPYCYYGLGTFGQ
jgi:hypothetical protein